MTGIGVMKKSKVNYVEGQDTRQHHITGVALDGLTMEREKGLHAHIKYNYHNDINKSREMYLEMRIWTLVSL